MIKTNTFIIAIISFLLIFNAMPSAAEVSNPFTAKGEDEFTPEDREKMENDLKEEINTKILSLDTKLSLEIDSLRGSTSAGTGRRRPGADSELDSKNPGDFKNPGLFGENFEEPEEEIEKDPKTTRLSNAKFVGCVDKKVLFKDNKTNENFFVTIEEAEENEEIGRAHV